MAAEYLTLLTALLAAALGGGIALLTTFLTNRANTARLQLEHSHEAKRRKSELLRERGEELYELTDKWLKILAGHYIGRSIVMQGKMTYDQFIEGAVKIGKEHNVNFGRIQMLIDVYFPAVRPQYDAVLAGRTELNRVDSAHLRAHENGDAEAEKLLGPYVVAQQVIEVSGELLKKKIIECIQAID